MKLELFFPPNWTVDDIALYVEKSPFVKAFPGLVDSISPYKHFCINSKGFVTYFAWHFSIEI